jgi:hypothetical protein
LLQEQAHPAHEIVYTSFFFDGDALEQNCAVGLRNFVRHGLPCVLLQFEILGDQIAPRIERRFVKDLGHGDEKALVKPPFEMLRESVDADFGYCGNSQGELV